jgi:hypothetical protein
MVLRIDAMAAEPARNPSIRKPLREGDIDLVARRGTLRPRRGHPKTGGHDHRCGADPCSDDAGHFHESALPFQFACAAIVPPCSGAPLQSATNRRSRGSKSTRSNFPIGTNPRGGQVFCPHSHLALLAKEPDQQLTHLLRLLFVGPMAGSVHHMDPFELRVTRLANVLGAADRAI